MFKLALPLLHVSDSAKALAFFCEDLGFTLEFAHRGDPSRQDPCYAGLTRDGVWLILSSFPGDGLPGGVVNFVVTGLDELHTDLLARNVPIDLAPTDQTWGTREMYVEDADGNSIRFQQLPA